MTPPKDKAEGPKATSPVGAYTVLVGISYPTASGEAYARPGATVTDLPEKSVKWLVQQGLIAPKSHDAKEA